MSDNKKYLVTGGTGFIGNALVRRLVNDGHEVTVLDNNLRGKNTRLADIKDNIELVNGDIRDLNTVKEACNGMDAICHLAYLNGTEFFYQKPDLVLDIAVKGMINVIDACKEEGIKELILASSSEVYQSPTVVPTPESVPLIVPDPHNPRYSYGGGKIICELMCINYGRKYFDRALIFRPHNVYGPDMGEEHVLPQFIRRMKQLSDDNTNGALDFPIQGTGTETRSFIFIDDFIDALSVVIEKGEHLGIYHIGTTDEKTIRDVVKIVANDLGISDINIIPGNLAEGGTLRRCPDISKVMQLGFSPKVPFAEGVRKMAEWYLEHPI